MSVRINLDTSDYNKFYKVNLEGQVRVFHLYWNDANSKRDFTKSGWYISFYDSSLFDFNQLAEDQRDALIRGGIKIMPNDDIFRQADSELLPNGILAAVDTQPWLGKADETYFVGLDNFGADKRFELTYFTEDEVKAFISAQG